MATVGVKGLTINTASAVFEVFSKRQTSRPREAAIERPEAAARGQGFGREYPLSLVGRCPYPYIVFKILLLITATAGCSY